MPPRHERPCPWCRFRAKLIDLAAFGHQVLSWRWDCEETAQIWANCADVSISAATSAAPAVVEA